VPRRVGRPRRARQRRPAAGQLRRARDRRRALPNTPENLLAWIRSPQTIDPGNVMPNLGVTALDAADIAAYLFSLE
jgi:cytochrome c1